MRTKIWNFCELEVGERFTLADTTYNLANPILVAHIKDGTLFEKIDDDYAHVEQSDLTWKMLAYTDCLGER
jgi:hypothetical protein